MRIIPSKNQYIEKLLPFLAIYGVHLLGAFNDIMEIDAAQYAAISWEAASSNEYLEIKQEHKDYLDKPPLLFWISALSFKVFGFTNFAYRFLPTLLSFLGAYATYRLAKIYYSEQVAYWSSLILASSQAIFLMNQDLRTDNLLTTFVVFSIWQLATYFQNNTWKNLFLGVFGVAMAMMAKGPIGLVIPILAFSVDFAHKRQWQNFFRWQYIPALLLLALFLLPMSIGLYQQFDLHPEKMVNGQKAVSGLKFFYWTQSFGRITGENVWSNNPDPFFLVHTTFWSFLPWTLFLVIAFVRETKELILNKFKKIELSQEVLIWAGFTLTFIALSRSKYQLNHYIYVVYPLGAIMTAKWIEKMSTWRKSWQAFFRFWLLFQHSILLLLAIILGFWAFPIDNYGVLFLVIAFFGLAFYFVFKPQNHFQRYLLPYLFSILAANTLMNAWVYPTLLQKYQTESIIAKKMKGQPQKYNLADFYVLGEGLMNNSLDFYTQQINTYVGSLEQISKSEAWIACNNENYEKHIASSSSWEVLEKEVFEDYHVSELTPLFLNPKTRKEQLQKVYLLKIRKKL
ncbi:MAG: glycosyltransferase family 39 protein [Thermonemataceae bacterium]|nr:glycosyltransferase family 39 protein [Thermonemataceae bacterium]